MKLIDKIQSLDDNEDVYIGSKSAFFFIGKPSEFMEELYSIDTQLYDMAVRRVIGSKARLTTHKNSKPKKGMSEVKRVWVDCNKVNKVFTYDELIVKWEEKLKILENTVKSNIQLVDTYKHLKDREVKESYRNIDNNANIVVVEGEESARFWFKSEWDRYKNGENIFIYEDDEEEEDEE